MIYPKLPVVFLSTIASEKEGSTNSQIASYLLNHLEACSIMGIREMAEHCHVAVSSISRFCKEIGLRDFAELRELLSGTDLYFQESSSALSAKQRLQDYHAKIQESLDEVAQSVDMSRIAGLCRSIYEHERVAIFGLLKAGSVALNLQGDLLMLGKNVYTQIAYANQMDYILNATSDHLIIIFSYTGSYFDYQELRDQTKKLYQSEICLITGTAKAYPDYIDHVITFHSRHDQLSHPYQLQFIAGLIAQEYAYQLDRLK